MKNGDRRGQNSHLLEIDGKLMQNQSKNQHYRSIDIDRYLIFDQAAQLLSNVSQKIEIG
jgi:hypothetical protein